MQSKVALISDEVDFFDYISSRLSLRKYDELYKFKFEDLPDKLHLLTDSVLIINSENSKEQTFELLNLLSGTPVMVFAFNDDLNFKISVLKAGAMSFLTPLTTEKEIQVYLLNALRQSALLSKNIQYREFLVNKNLILNNNEVFLDYNSVLEIELERLAKTSTSSILVAISPDDKTKFLLQPNQIETIILNNIRKNDILMSYAQNKYFLILKDIDISNAEKIWSKIEEQIPQMVYAGFAKTYMKSRQQIVNEVLARLHEAINCKKSYSKAQISNDIVSNGNFKIFKREFNKKIEQVIIPTFYQIKQKYLDKFQGVTIEENINDGVNSIVVKSRTVFATFKITTPGFSKVNIDILYQNGADIIDSKRISLTPEELEVGLLEDLLEQFILEFRKENKYGNT